MRSCPNQNTTFTPRTGRRHAERGRAGAFLPAARIRSGPDHGRRCPSRSHRPRRCVRLRRADAIGPAPVTSTTCARSHRMCANRQTLDGGPSVRGLVPPHATGANPEGWNAGHATTMTPSRNDRRPCLALRNADGPSSDRLPTVAATVEQRDAVYPYLQIDRPLPDVWRVGPRRDLDPPVRRWHHRHRVA